MLLASNLPASAAAAGYSDVPPNHWASDYINQATQLGVINGIGNGQFGVGQTVTRAQFAAMLVRLFQWKPVAPASPSFTDNKDKNTWYYSAIETALANGAIVKEKDTFRPNDSMTREDMAIMLVRALGYDTMASAVAGYGLPFQDVTKNTGYITIAYNFGIINGMTDNAFVPGGSATREQAAAMMIRLHVKYSAKLDWLHAFYAISSAAQMSSIPDFNAISLGWSRLEYAETGGVILNTTSSGGNAFCFPSGYSSVAQSVQNANVSANLNVYMSTAQTVTKSDGTVTNACREILLNPQNRSAAISQIIGELKSNAFLSGVTIDFEGMSGADLKAGLNAFLKDLRTATNEIGKKVAVCVAPVTSDGQYFNAYDYRTIGEYSDKVILMAHDYQTTSMPSNLMAAGFTTTPLTPISEVFYAMKAITDGKTGVQDKSKVALAISFNTVQWQLQNNKVINQTPYHPDTESVYKRLIDPNTSIFYSKKYENAYATFYNSSNNTQNVVWYEDGRSIMAKVNLARMFGVNSISVWRLGLIPNYADSTGRTINYNVLDLLKSE
jgi:spore germination protein YaaH